MNNARNIRLVWILVLALVWAPVGVAMGSPSPTKDSSASAVLSVSVVSATNAGALCDASIKDQCVQHDSCDYQCCGGCSVSFSMTPEPQASRLNLPALDTLHAYRADPDSVDLPLRDRPPRLNG